MKPDKYQQRCLETWFDDSKPLKDHMLHVAMGLNSEAGEFASLIDKQVYKPSKQITREMMLDELGDIWYNVVIAAHLLGVTIDELDQMNAEKLRDGHGWVELDSNDCLFCGMDRTGKASFLIRGGLFCDELHHKLWLKEQNDTP